MVIDGGDRHLRSGSDVCAQAVHMRDVHAACARGAPAACGGQERIAQPRAGTPCRVEREQQPQPQRWQQCELQLGFFTKASMREFKCVRHVLRPDEVRAGRRC